MHTAFLASQEAKGYVIYANDQTWEAQSVVSPNNGMQSLWRSSQLQNPDQRNYSAITAQYLVSNNTGPNGSCAYSTEFLLNAWEQYGTHNWKNIGIEIREQFESQDSKRSERFWLQEPSYVGFKFSNPRFTLTAGLVAISTRTKSPICRAEYFTSDSKTSHVCHHFKNFECPFLSQLVDLFTCKSVFPEREEPAHRVAQIWSAVLLQHSRLVRWPHKPCPKRITWICVMISGDDARPRNPNVLSHVSTIKLCSEPVFSNTQCSPLHSSR